MRIRRPDDAQGVQRDVLRDGGQEGQTIELQWSGDGNDPRVQQRVQVMLENFGPPRGLLLAGVKNNRLHPKHQPSDISDNLHQWTDQDFAP